MSNETSPQNIASLLHQRVATSPEKLFLFSEADGRKISYAGFEQAVTRTAAMLEAAGLEPHDRQLVRVRLLRPIVVPQQIADRAAPGHRRRGERE